jgi:C-terminal processing protease CtpA/Prc
MFGPGGMLMNGQERDDNTASVGDDYSYARQYKKNQGYPDNMLSRNRVLSEDYTRGSSVNSSALGAIANSIVSDDASFEQQFFEQEQRFDVVAPAGKLGMVIDTPQGGSPVVHAIKDTSVLYDQVRVGDRLISVDGENCTTMTAMQVSKLISLKAEKPARVLVFVRSSGGGAK